MKTIGMFMALAAALTLLPGCASAPQVQDRSHLVIDSEKMSAVDRVARREGVGVIWVNPPLKRAGDEEDEDDRD